MNLSPPLNSFDYNDDTPPQIYQQGPVVLDSSPNTYGVFTICPFNVETIPLYLQIGGKWFFDSTIKPHILNVNVTYNSTGFVTLEPLLQTSTNPAINTSSVISTIISALTYHLYIAQAPDMNLAVEGIFGAYNTYPSSGVGDYEPLAGLVAAYIRGVIEDEATNLRYELPNWVPEVPQQPVPVMIYETFVFWGPASPKHKLLVVAAPLLIMLSTIVILLVAFY